MTKFSMVSTRLEVELLASHQQMREAFSKAEVAEAREKKSTLESFNSVSLTNNKVTVKGVHAVKFSKLAHFNAILVFSKSSYMYHWHGCLSCLLHADSLWNISILLYCSVQNKYGSKCVGLRMQYRRAVIIRQVQMTSCLSP